MSEVIQFPRKVKTTEAMFPTYYLADTDEIVIPRLPADQDTAAAVLGSWAEKFTEYGILKPNDCYKIMDKVFHRGDEIVRT